MIYEVSQEHGISDYFYCQKVTRVSHPPRIHSHMEMVFMLDGEMKLSIAGNEYILEKGRMAFVMPYEIHSYSIKNEGEIFVIACPPEYISEYREVFKGKEFEMPITFFGDAQKTIISDIVKNDFQNDFKKKALIYSALSEFTESCCLKEKNLFEYDVYRKAIVYISENYTENITMRSVAEYVGVTAPHLSRVLNSNGKPGFSAIINSLRIYAAKKMLERENVSVSEAAYAVGYGSIRNFNRVFKEYFGYNPSDFGKDGHSGNRGLNDRF